jgi:hypothetical protein
VHAVDDGKGGWNGLAAAARAGGRARACPAAGRLGEQFVDVLQGV